MPIHLIWGDDYEACNKEIEEVIQTVRETPEIEAYRIGLLESAKKVFDAVLTGKFKIEISKKYSLDQVKQAHEDLEGRLLTGPAVIKP